MSAEKHLLFGLLALQNEFIDKPSLVAALGLWMADKQKSLDQILIEQGALTAELAALLNQLVNQHIAKRGGDVQASLNALSPQQNIRAELEQIADQDLYASLAQLKETDPFQTAQVGEVNQGGARFQILRPLDRGGLGIVSVAVDKELNREVALKEIRLDRAHNQAFKQKFLLEAEVTGGLEHPNIVPVYGLGTYADGRPYYAMRLIKGDNLREHIRLFHKLVEEGKEAFDGPSLRKLLRRYLDVCEAIDYAHSRGILHRDLKPGNVMLGKYGETLVVDWGLAKPLRSRATPDVQETRGTTADISETPIIPLSGSDDATQQGSMIGTPAYAPPEQLSGRLHEVDVRSDVYGLGAILYEVLTGNSPGVGQTLEETIQNVIHGRITAPRSVNARIPAALEAVCLRAMSVDPARRYRDANLLRQEVERWLDDLPVAAYREPAIIRLKRWVRAHQTLAVTATATILVSILGLSIFSTVLSQKNSRLSKLNSDLDSKNTELEASNERERSTSAELKLGKAQLERNALELQLRNAYLACENGRIEDGLAGLADVLRRAVANKQVDMERRVRRLLAGWSQDHYFSFPLTRSNDVHKEFLAMLANFYEFSADGQWLVIGLHRPENDQPVDPAVLEKALNGEIDTSPVLDVFQLFHVERSDSEPSGVQLKLHAKWSGEMASNVHFFGSEPTLAYVTPQQLVVRDVKTGSQKEYPLPRGFFREQAVDLWPVQLRYHPQRKRLIAVGETGIYEVDVDSGDWKTLLKLDRALYSIPFCAISTSQPLRVAIVDAKGIQLYQPELSSDPQLLAHLGDTKSDSSKQTSAAGQSLVLDTCNSLDFNETGTILFAGGALTSNPAHPTETGWYQAWKLASDSTTEASQQWTALFPQPRTCVFDTLIVRRVAQDDRWLVATGPNLFDSSPSTLQLVSLDNQALSRSVTTMMTGDSIMANGRGSSSGGNFMSVAIGGPRGTDIWRVAASTRLLNQMKLDGQINCAVFAGPKDDLYVGISPSQSKASTLLCFNSPNFDNHPIAQQRALGQIRSICTSDDAKRIFWTGESTGCFTLEPPKLTVYSRQGGEVFSRSRSQKNVLGLAPQNQLLAVLSEENDLSGFLGSTKRSKISFTSTASGSERGTFELKDVIFQALAIGRNDVLMTGCSDHSLRFWDVASKTEKSSSKQFSVAIDLVIAHPKSAVYAVATSDGAVHILTWDNQVKSDLVLPHLHRVRAASLNADGTLLATGCEDGTAYVWDTATGECIGPPVVHDQSISAVAFSSDSRVLFTAAGDVGRYWKVPTPSPEPAEALINRISYLTGAVVDEQSQKRTLSKEERLKRLGRDVSSSQELHIWPDTN